jgi:hypothetical protein
MVTRNERKWLFGQSMRKILTRRHHCCLNPDVEEVACNSRQQDITLQKECQSHSKSASAYLLAREGTGGGWEVLSTVSMWAGGASLKSRLGRNDDTSCAGSSESESLAVSALTM